MSLSPLLPLLFLFPFPPSLLVLQLSENKHARTKRQAVGGDETSRPHVVESQAAITLLGARKESYLLVRKGIVRSVINHSIYFFYRHFSLYLYSTFQTAEWRKRALCNKR